MTMKEIVNEAVAEALVEQIAKKLMYQLSGQYGLVLQEMQKTNESNTKLWQKTHALQAEVAELKNTVTQNLTQIREQLSIDSQNKEKAAKLLDKAIDELGLGE